MTTKMTGDLQIPDNRASGNRENAPTISLASAWREDVSYLSAAVSFF
jgi:hypothetical protein